MTQQKAVGKPTVPFTVNTAFPLQGGDHERISFHTQSMRGSGPIALVSAVIVLLFTLTTGITSAQVPGSIRLQGRHPKDPRKHRPFD